MDAKVIFKYQKDQDDELNLEVGDLLVDVVTVDDGWCEGTLKTTGVRGMFPDNFVEMIEPSQPKPPPPAAVSRTPQVPEIHVPKRDSQGPPRRRAKVTYSFAATNEDELSLEPGDIVEILEEEEEGWWRGLLNDKEGVFPSNFVTAIKEVEDPPPQPPKSHERTRPPSMVAMPGMGGVNPLEIKNKLKSMSKTPVPPPESKGPSIAERPRTNTASRMTRALPKAKVMFLFEATEADEITVKEGEVVEVIDKSTDQDGWWMVRREGGQEGLVPDNFLEVIEKALPPEPKPFENVAHIQSQPPLPPKKVEAPKPNVPIPGARAVLPKLPDKNEFPPEKPDPFSEPPPAAVPDELEVPHNGLLDNNKVKDRPKKNPARPPSKSNLQTPDEEVDVASKRPEPVPVEDKGDEVTGGVAPWQQEARNRKNKSVVPPPVVTPTKINAPGTRPKPNKASKPPPQVTAKPLAPPTQTATPGKSVSTGTLSGGVSTLPRSVEPSTTAGPLDTEVVPSGQWKEGFESLQEEFAKFKKEMKEDMRILAQDLDEERKKNASLKIDVQRLMKTAGFREREIVIS